METIQFNIKPAKPCYMQGSPVVPFSELVRSNIEAHGVEYTKRFYLERGMSPWEVSFWIKAAS